MDQRWPAPYILSEVWSYIWSLLHLEMDQEQQVMSTVQLPVRLQ